MKLVDETSLIDILYFAITGVSTFLTLILIVTLVLNLQQKITTSTKNCNLFVSIETIRHFRNEKVTDWSLNLVQPAIVSGVTAIGGEVGRGWGVGQSPPRIGAEKHFYRCI